MKITKYEIEDDTKACQNLPCSWIGRINLTKMPHTAESNLHIQCELSKNTYDVPRPRKNYEKICVETQKIPHG